jgi:hypothetical protein
VRRITTIGTAAAILTAGLGSTAAAAAHGPTPGQIRRAVAGATRSSYLWATVNVCENHRKGGVMGVRGEMPALGFSATESMTIQLRQYDSRRRRYVSLGGAARQIASLGAIRTGVRQNGIEFPFDARTGTLDATVTFTWTRAGRRLAQVTRTTTGGHPSAAFGRPRHHTAPTCRL